MARQESVTLGYHFLQLPYVADVLSKQLRNSWVHLDCRRKVKADTFDRRAAVQKKKKMETAHVKFFDQALMNFSAIAIQI